VKWRIPVLPGPSQLIPMASNVAERDDSKVPSHEHSSAAVLDERRRAALAEIDNAKFKCALTSFVDFDMLSYVPLVYDFMAKSS
jgi:hypothetical protein